MLTQRLCLPSSEISFLKYVVHVVWKSYKHFLLYWLCRKQEGGNLKFLYSSIPLCSNQVKVPHATVWNICKYGEVYVQYYNIVKGTIWYISIINAILMVKYGATCGDNSQGYLIFPQCVQYVITLTGEVIELNCFDYTSLCELHAMKYNLFLQENVVQYLALLNKSLQIRILGV